MARSADDLRSDPAVVVVNPGDPVGRIEVWLSLIDEDESVDLGTSAASILAEVRRESGEA